MKKTLLSVITALLIFFNINAQEKKQHPAIFKYQQLEEPTNKLSGWASRLNNYIVVQSPGTVEENYTKIMDFIKVTYSNPDQVIDVTSENKFIRIKGLAPGLYYTSSLPLMSDRNDIRYTMTIYVKENRMKVELNSMEYKSVSTDYEVPSRYRDLPLDKVPQGLIKEVEVVKWNTLGKIYLHKYSGKPKKRVFGKTDAYIENYFNGLVGAFLKYSKSMSKDSDW